MADQTVNILNYFEQINAIPRCSGDEARLCRWLQQWARDRGLAFQNDAAGNLVIQVPATAGQEHFPGVVLQGHMDMVCEKTPQSRHDFKKDPIISRQQGDWLCAQGTTLGADNGIALAYMLTLADQPEMAHPPLELLFTVDEETGLNGAKALRPGFISGGYLINLDSEDEGILTIGCAGGVDTEIRLDIQTENIPADARIMQVVVGGLRGGHSGIDIHRHRANANKLLARTLMRIRREGPLGLVALSGGSRKNAIPRDAQAMIWVGAPGEATACQAVAQMQTTIKAEFASIEPDLFIHCEPVSEPPTGASALTQADTDKAIRLLLSLPNGVADMSTNLEGLVETSSNLATADIKDQRFCVVTSQRSATMSRLDEITAAIHAVAELAGATSEDRDAYPAWPPKPNSRLLGLAEKSYRRLFVKEPVIQAIHAGLECAIIGHIYPEMEMISFGPTMCNPHSPDERLFIPSVQKVWEFLTALLNAMCE
jgi:dipeptidase D